MAKTPADRNNENPIEERYEQGQGSYRGEESSSIKDLANQEKAGNANNISGDSADSIKEQEEAAGFTNKFTGNGAPTSRRDRFIGKLKGSKKRNSAIAAIAGFLAIVFIVILLAPSLLFIHFAETVTEKLNWQGGSMSARTAKVYAGMMKPTSGFCSETVSIRCKFRSMTDGQIQRLEDAGIKVIKNESETITGRKKVTALEYKGKTITASNFSSELRGNLEFRSAARSAYNPWFAGFFDKVTTKVYTKLGLSRKPIFGPDLKTDEERNAKLKEATKHGLDGGDTGRPYVRDPETGKFFDENGNEIPEDVAQAHNSAIEKAEELRKLVGDVEESDSKVTRNVLKAADEVLSNPARSFDPKSLSAGLIAAPDSACTLVGLFNAVSYGAKTIRSLQLARYAMVFLNSASAAKAGEITPEVATYIGDILTKTVTETLPDGTTETTKAATDSYGYRYIAYGDIGPPTITATEFLAGGGLGGKMNGIADSIIGVLPGSVSDSRQKIQEFCGVVKNPFVQAGALIISVGILFTGPVGWAALGGSLAMGAMTDIVLSVASSVLTPIIADIIAGNLIDDSTFGEAAGDAIVSGSGVIMTNLAQHGGNAPLRPEQAVAYMNTTQATAVAYHKEDDRTSRSPLDPTSPNTFLGSIVTKFLPYSGKISSVTDFATTSFSVASRSLQSIVNPYSSAAENTIDHFTLCDDEEYKRLGVATDAFCNPVRGIPERYLQDDPVDVIDRLIVSESIDENTGQPRSDTVNGKRYSDFIKDCIDREEPLGYVGEDFNIDDGSKCFIEDSSDGDGIIPASLKADWYVFHIDQRVLDGIDNGYDISDPDCGPTTSTTTTTGDNWPTAAKIDELIEMKERSNNTTSPLHGLGNKFIEFGSKYGINPGIVAAILLRETQLATDGSSLYKPPFNNIGGNTAIPGNPEAEGTCGSAYWGDRYYKVFCTPEDGLEGVFKNLDMDHYRETDGTVAAVMEVYSPSYENDNGAAMYSIFGQAAEVMGITIEASTPVYTNSQSTASSSAGSSVASSVTSTASFGMMSEDELKSQMTSYGLPAPQKDGDGGYDALVAKIQDNPDALWATQEMLNGEKLYKSKGGEIKEYLTTAWVWFETGPWADPYEVNCMSNTRHPTDRTCQIGTSPDKVQVAGYQAWDVRHKFREIYRKLYSESQFQSVLQNVINNSSKASIDEWKYDTSSASARIQGATLNDVYAESGVSYDQFNNDRTQFISFMLGKDPAMAAALNSFAVTDSDVVAMLRDCRSLPWSNNAYYCDPGLRQKIANMMMALWIIDKNSPSKGSSCAAVGGYTAGKGLGSIVEGTPNPENNFKAEWGNNLYGYGAQYGLNGSAHTGIDIPGKRGAAVYTPVSGTVRCAKTDDIECIAFNSYKQDPGNPDACTNFNLRDGTGLVEINLDNGHVLILGHTLTSLVQVGQRVEAGQQVATVGCMNGHHIHVEYRIPNPAMPSGYEIVDPEQYLGGSAS